MRVLGAQGSAVNNPYSGLFNKVSALLKNI